MNTQPIEIVRRELDTEHYYWVNGEFFPGVTKILDEAAPTPYALKQFFINNNSQEIAEIKESTGGFGSKLHDAYEKLLNGVELNLKDDYPTTKEKKHLASFYEWYQEVKPTNLQTEQTVASLTHRYAGTLDLFCMINGEAWIIDFKTSNGIYWSHELQLAAYKQAYEETYPEVSVQHVGILRTGSKHKKGYEFKEITRPFEDFKQVYNTYLSMHDGKIPEPPSIDVYPDKLKLEIGK